MHNRAPIKIEELEDIRCSVVHYRHVEPDDDDDGENEDEDGDDSHDTNTYQVDESCGDTDELECRSEQSHSNQLSTASFEPVQRIMARSLVDLNGVNGLELLMNAVVELAHTLTHTNEINPLVLFWSTSVDPGAVVNAWCARFDGNTNNTAATNVHMTVNAMDTLQQALNIMAEAPIDVRLTEYEMSFFEDSLAEFPSAAYVWPLSRMSAYTRLNVATLLANARRCFTKVYPSGVIGRGSALYQHFKFNELFEDNFSRANLVSTYIRALVMVAFQRGVWYSIQPVLSAIMQERLMSCYTRSQKLKSVATSNYAHHHHTNVDSSRAIARLATLASAYSSVLTLITGPDLLLWLNVAPP